MFPYPRGDGARIFNVTHLDPLSGLVTRSDIGARCRGDIGAASVASRQNIFGGRDIWKVCCWC